MADQTQHLSRNIALPFEDENISIEVFAGGSESDIKKALYAMHVDLKLVRAAVCAKGRIIAFQQHGSSVWNEAAVPLFQRNVMCDKNQNWALANYAVGDNVYTLNCQGHVYENNARIGVGSVWHYAYFAPSAKTDSEILKMHSAKYCRT